MSSRPRRERRGQTEEEPDHHRVHSLPNDQREHVRGLRAERHAHADLARALLDGVGDRAVDADRREEERDAGENAEQDAIVRRACPSDCVTISLHHLRLDDRRGWDRCCRALSAPGA